MQTRTRWWWTPLALFAPLALVACDGGRTGPYRPGDTSFVSTPPGYTSGTGGETDLGNGAPEQGRGDDAGDGGGERTVEEADIVRVDGDTLYVLNSWRGLQVVDLTNPDAPALVGMLPVQGRPIEMYVRDDRAYLVVADFYGYDVAVDAADGTVGPVARFRGSRIVVVDVAQRSRPTVVGRFDVPGEITDTRIVGDVLYTVSNRSPWYGYAEVVDAGGAVAVDAASGETTVDGTWVTSIDVSDPADIREVDAVSFPRSGWDNHVHVTPEVIYVASSGYEWDGQTGEYRTRIQYVDIANPHGRITVRGEASVPGFVRDRWMLDEYTYANEGRVLRVVTAPDWGSSAPYVTTLQVLDGQLTQLGRTTLTLPRPESLTAVRFDGERAYVVTYERVDPLFVVDLSVPAAPLQRGELEMPGWLDHIAPRGDRLVALGHDDSTGRMQLAVSLFDVTDPDLPLLLKRVSFGEDWGWIPDERDNYDKVFKVLDDLGLVLVPFHSWGFDETTGYWEHAGGVQLVDLVDLPIEGAGDGVADDLTLRGLIRHPGLAKRALPHGNRILTVSDEALLSVDATDRDAPRVTGELELARNVVDFARVGDVGVQLVGDWYAGDTRLVVVPTQDPDLGAPIAEVKVTAPYGRMFVNGAYVYLVSQDWRTGVTEVRVVDLTTPSSPRITGQVQLPEALGYWGGWYYAGWGGDELVQVAGDTLVFHAYRYGYRGYLESGGTVPDESYDRLYVVDLSDPAAPSLASTVVLRDSDWVYGLKARGDTLFFTQYEWLEPDDQGWPRVRYHMVRYDLSDPARPSRLAKTNVPGYVVDLSDDGSHVYTLDYERVGDGSMRLSVNALRLRGDVAELADRMYVDGWVGQLVREGRNLWVQTSRAVQDPDGGWRNESTLLAVDLLEPRDLSVVGRVSIPDGYGWLREIAGGRAFVDLGWQGGLLVYDVRTPSDIRFERYLRHPGWISGIEVRDGIAYLALGWYGVTHVDLDAAAAE